MWILPTRNRQAFCQRFLDACVETKMTSPGILVMDGCFYRDLRVPPNWQTRATEHMELCGVLRKVFEDFPDEPFYGVVADDLVPITPHWDKRLEKAAGTWAISSCNDSWCAPERMAGATCLGGDLLRALGYIVPSGMVHLYVDDLWETIGNGLDCWTVLMDVTVEHRHFGNRKAKHDPTYVRKFNGQQYAQADRQAFGAWKQTSEKELAHVADLRSQARQRLRA